MDADQNLTATFAPARTLTVALAGTGSGNVSAAPFRLGSGVAGGYIDCPRLAGQGGCSSSYSLGATPYLNAQPSAGSRFVGWTGGGCSGMETLCTVTMDADQAVTATFAPDNAFTSRVKGRELLVSVTVAGAVRVTDAAAKPLTASASTAKERKLLLKPSSASGGPGTIAVPLSLTKAAKRTLREKGKLRLRARITFTPIGGLAKSHAVTLKLKGK
jgi:hypothetical protein